MTGVIHATAALSEANRDPIGGPIAAAIVAGLVHQSFQKQGQDLIAALPILRELAG